MERTNASEYFYRMRLNSNSQLDGIINIKNLYAYDKAGNLVNSNFFADDSTV